MGAAALAYALWTRFLKHYPANPGWFDRDRFVLSPGHGSMLLYSLLHLTGYDLPLEQIKRFRESGSMTPGHPERGVAPGIETTTGPLGQGFGNGVGSRDGRSLSGGVLQPARRGVVDHFTYGIVSDGDLMEGVSSEAASLAGHLKLGKLIYLYDDNRVTLSAGTDINFPRIAPSALRLMAGTSSRSPTATISRRSTRRCARLARKRSVPPLFWHGPI